MHSKIILTSAAFAVLAHPAWGHVTLGEPSAKASSYYVAHFRIGHGCAGSPTTSLRIAIPEGIASARPEPKPGWTLEIARAPVSKPAVGEMGEKLTERVSAITWTGGPLPADQFDEFAVLMKLPDTLGSLAFPATQTCQSGIEHWSDLPAEGVRLKHPAPVLNLIPEDSPTAMPEMDMKGMNMQSTHGK